MAATSGNLPAYSVTDPRQQAPVGGPANVSNPGFYTYAPAPPTCNAANVYPNQYSPMAPQMQPVQPVQQQHCSNVTVVTTQPSLVPVVAVRRNLMPDDHLVLSILACLFCNWICGLIAIIYSLQVSPAWEAGNYEEARAHSHKARTWSVIAIVSHVVTGVVGGLILFIVVIVQ